MSEQPSSNPILAAEINALPDRVRQYIHDLETDADPAGDKWRLLALEQNLAGLVAEIERLRSALEKLTNGYKYSTEVITIAKEALATSRGEP